MIKNDTIFREKCEKFSEIVNKSQSIAIISHLSPDGDNIGSMNAVYKTLKQMGKNVDAIELDIIPESLTFLALDDFSDSHKDAYDLVICLDCANIERLGDISECLKNSSYIVNIDHHKSNEMYGDLNIVYPMISSTSELLYHIFIEIDFTISQEVATSIFTGIMTDTYRFLYPSADSETLSVASHLIDLGANKELIMTKLFQSDKINAKKLRLKILNRSEFIGLNTAITVCYLSDIEEYNLEMSDIDSVVNYYRDADEIILSILLKEKEENVFKVSFRSKGDYDVNTLASLLGGGGHKNAAGGILYGDYESCKKQIIEQVINLSWISY